MHWKVRFRSFDVLKYRQEFNTGMEEKKLSNKDLLCYNERIATSAGREESDRSLADESLSAQTYVSATNIEEPKVRP